MYGAQRGSQSHAEACRRVLPLQASALRSFRNADPLLGGEVPPGAFGTAASRRNDECGSWDAVGCTLQTVRQAGEGQGSRVVVTSRCVHDPPDAPVGEEGRTTATVTSIDPADAATSRTGTSPDPDAAWQLSPSQREILSLTAEGYSYVEIAQMLGISDSTVRAQVHRVRLKLSRDMPESAAESSWRLAVDSSSRASEARGRQRWPEGSFVGQLSDAERDALLSAGVPVCFEDDQIMLVQGDRGDFVYVLTDGLAKELVAMVSGAETTLAIRSRGDLVGDFAALDGKPQHATVRAAGEVTALRVSGTAFLAITSRSREVQTVLTRYVMGKFRATTERRAAERVWDARERLAQVLYDLAQEHAEPGPGGTVRIPLSQSELGELAGVSVSTTERILKDLRKQGIISTRYREITIRDMAWLRSIRFPQ